MSYPVSKAAHGEFSQPGGQDWQDVVSSGRPVEGEIEEDEDEARSYSRREREALLRRREGLEEV